MAASDVPHKPRNTTPDVKRELRGAELATSCSCPARATWMPVRTGRAVGRMLPSVCYADLRTAGIAPPRAPSPSSIYHVQPTFCTPLVAPDLPPDGVAGGGREGGGLGGGQPECSTFVGQRGGNEYTTSPFTGPAPIPPKRRSLFTSRMYQGCALRLRMSKSGDGRRRPSAVVRILRVRRHCRRYVMPHLTGAPPSFWTNGENMDHDTNVTMEVRDSADDLAPGSPAHLAPSMTRPVTARSSWRC
jgi:hypothetical protein